MEIEMTVFLHFMREVREFPNHREAVEYVNHMYDMYPVGDYYSPGYRVTDQEGRLITSDWLGGLTEAEWDEMCPF